MDWTSIAIAVIGSGMLVSLVVSGHAWLKSHAAQTTTKVDDNALAAFDTIVGLAAHNTTLSEIIAKSANKIDDAALKLVQGADAEINKPAA